MMNAYTEHIWKHEIILNKSIQWSEEKKRKEYNPTTYRKFIIIERKQHLYA